MGPATRDTVLVLLFVLLVPTVQAGPRTVQLEVGPVGQTLTRTIDAPNLVRSGSSTDRWIPATSPAALPRVPAGASMPNRNAPLPAGPQRFPHLAQQGQTAGAPSAAAPDGLNGVAGAAPPAVDADLPVVAVLNGDQGGDFTAAQDGKIALNPLLRTYDSATMTVRLFNADGSEVLFGGRPLLEWKRPDDTTRAPLAFQGRTDSGSMVLEKSGDYSPKEGLSYELPVKQGQRITVEVTGRPTSDSELGIRSNVLK